MRTFHIDSRVLLPKPLHEVFPFFADAHNLETLTPPWLRFEVLTPRPIAMRVGQRIDYKLRVHGIPLRWQSEITIWEPPYRFVDEQIRGPYHLWHHEHRFSERDGMTLAEDHVEYAPRGGALINWLLVERDVRRIFEFRREKMEELFNRTTDGTAAEAA